MSAHCSMAYRCVMWEGRRRGGEDERRGGGEEERGRGGEEGRGGGEERRGGGEEGKRGGEEGRRGREEGRRGGEESLQTAVNAQCTAHWRGSASGHPKLEGVRWYLPSKACEVRASQERLCGCSQLQIFPSCLETFGWKYPENAMSLG